MSGDESWDYFDIEPEAEGDADFLRVGLDTNPGPYEQLVVATPIGSPSASARLGTRITREEAAALLDWPRHKQNGEEVLARLEDELRARVAAHG